MRHAIETLRQLGLTRPKARRIVPWAIVTLLMAGAATAIGLSQTTSAGPEIVARVNGTAVYRAELQRVLADPAMRSQLQRELGTETAAGKELERLALRKLIAQQLVLQEASRRKLTVTQAELDQAVSNVRSRFKDVREFEAWLNTRGLNDGSLPETVRRELLGTRVRAALVEEVRLVEAQVDEYYKAHQDTMKTAEAVRLRVIAVKDKAEADRILAAARKGKDLDRVIRERSDIRDQQGWSHVRTLPPTLRDVVGTLKAGQTGGPIEQNRQFVVVRLEERRLPRPMSFAEARPQIERRLLAAKQQEVLKAWVAEQEKVARIETFLQ